MDVTIEAPKALVVDDEPAVARVVARLLSRQGYESVTVNDPLEGLAELRRSQFDLVITDLRMQGMDGIEFLSEVVAMRPDTTTVLLTGFGDHETATRARRAGADAFLTKDADEAEIQRCLNEAVMNKMLRLMTDPETDSQPTDSPEDQMETSDDTAQ